MMQYPAQSANVLNNADEMSRRLDFVIFSQENEVDYSTPGWVPGEPLFPDPRSVSDDDPYGLHDYQGNVVRPMYELFDDTESWYRPRCTACGVSWTGTDPCWMCNEVPVATARRAFLGGGLIGHVRGEGDAVLYPGAYPEPKKAEPSKKPWDGLTTVPRHPGTEDSEAGETLFERWGRFERTVMDRDGHERQLIVYAALDVETTGLLFPNGWTTSEIVETPELIGPPECFIEFTTQYVNSDDEIRAWELLTGYRAERGARGVQSQGVIYDEGERIVNNETPYLEEG